MYIVLPLFSKMKLFCNHHHWSCKTQPNDCVALYFYTTLIKERKSVGEKKKNLKRKITNKHLSNLSQSQRRISSYHKPGTSILSKYISNHILHHPIIDQFDLPQPITQLTLSLPPPPHTHTHTKNKNLHRIFKVTKLKLIPNL